MTAAAVELNDFGYRPAERERWAVRGLDLSFQPSEHVLLLGASGSGKSTLLRALAGLLDVGGTFEGDVRVDGLPAIAARERVGLLLQDPDAGIVLTRAGEDVAFGPQNRGVPPDEVTRRVAHALDAVGFRYPVTRPVAALSGGERQRLALAGVIALAPSLLLLDEPTSMLDPEGAAMVRDAVARVSATTGCTLIVVEHQVGAWLPLIHRVVILDEGGVQADGPPEEIRKTSAAANTWLATPSGSESAALTAGEVVLTADGVGYRHPRTEQFALQGATVALRARSALAITGANGAGKTTLARLLGGLASPTEGSVVASSSLATGIRSQNPSEWSARELAGRIGSVFQNPEHAFLARTVRDELAVGPTALGTSEQQVKPVVDDLLSRLRLEHLADQNPFTLSGGEQRRLSVGAALATAPRVLVLDEPTFGQDPTTWRQLATLTRGLRDSGTAIAVATHDQRFREQVCGPELHLAQPSIPDEAS